MKLSSVILFMMALTIGGVHAGLEEALQAQRSGDYATARKEFEALANKGDDKAMTTIGLMYYQGTGVTQDYSKAMDWYLKAYALKNGDALNNIGVLYRDGLGVTANQKIAYDLFLTVHMLGMGTESTQIRAGRNLSRLAESMSKKDLQEALSYTLPYVNQVVLSRGKNMKAGSDVLPSKERLRIRDLDWWLDSEQEQMKFESPAPWDKKGG
jgi:Sel1 repeat